MFQNPIVQLLEAVFRRDARHGISITEQPPGLLLDVVEVVRGRRYFLMGQNVNIEVWNFTGNKKHLNRHMHLGFGQKWISYTLDISVYFLQHTNLFLLDRHQSFIYKIWFTQAFYLKNLYLPR